MSYGINAPQGLKPHSYMNGSPWNGATQSFAIRSGQPDSIFKGDLVFFDNAARPATIVGATGTIQSAVMVQADFTAATIPLTLGVFMGCRYRQYVGGILQEINSPMWVGGTALAPIGAGLTPYAEAFVVTDPNVLFDIQCSSSQAATNATYAGISQGAIGQNFFLGLGILGQAAGATFGVFNTQLYYSDGNPVQQNPVGGNPTTGVSGVYLDVGGTGLSGGVQGKGTGVVAASARAQCKVVALTPQATQYNNLNTPLTLADDFASAPMQTQVGEKPRVNPGHFNNVLVKLNYHLFGVSSTAF